jgi:IclR family transcriptional regulator, KDG regulon repressor
MELIGGSSDGLSVQSVCRCLDMPRSTAHNLLKTLAARGYIERAYKPVRYRLADALRVLPRMESDRDLLMRAASWLLHLANQVDGEALFAEYIGGEVLAILRVPPGEPKVVTFPLTWRLGAYGTGLVFQAFLSPDRLREFRLRRPLSTHSTTTAWKSMREVDQYVAKVRETGYLVFDRGDIFRAAAPVFDQRQSIRAMMAVLIPQERITPELRRKGVRLVRQAAQELSQLPKA